MNLFYFILNIKYFLLQILFFGQSFYSLIIELFWHIFSFLHLIL